jgi:hypothetical protein
VVPGQTGAVSEWLVPVTRRLRFADRSGRPIDPTFDALRDATLAGRLDRVAVEVRGPLVDVGAGDRVWFTLPDPGVILVGTARAPDRGTDAVITVTIDRTRSRIFAGDPLPAATIRRWVPELRDGAVHLDLRPRALGVLDAWQHERAERDVELLSSLGAVPWRTANAGGTKGKGPSPAAHAVIGPIARLVRSQDFAIGLAKPVQRDPRLIARRVRDVVIVDVCPVKAGRGRDEAVAGIGPLLEARWRVEREPRDARLAVSLWMAFSARPHGDVTLFLEDAAVLVSWPQRGGVVELTDRSKQRWYQYLGLR